MRDGCSYYETYDDITEVFYNSYSKVLNDARFDTTLDIISQKIGDDNFSYMNDLVLEYTDISRFDKSEEAQKKRNELVKKSRELVEKIDKEHKKDVNKSDYEDMSI